MYLVRALAAAAVIMAVMPAAMAANAPDQRAAVQLVRGMGGGGFHGGGFHGGGFHGGGFRAGDVHSGGFRGAEAMRGGWHYRPGIDLLPYAYACPYPPYYNPYCTFPQG
jgi:hypothetical protein